MTRLVIAPRAAADLEEIAAYIARDNPRAALRTIQRLEDTSVMLSQYPRIGTARDDIRKGVKVFPVGQYLILFRALTDGVEVARYVHGARRLKGLV